MNKIMTRILTLTLLTMFSLGAWADQTITIKTNGRGTVAVTSVNSPATFSGEASPYTIVNGTGVTVTLSVEPEEGYYLGNIYAQPTASNDMADIRTRGTGIETIELKRESEGIYSFIMPEASENVYVVVSFVNNPVEVCYIASSSGYNVLNESNYYMVPAKDPQKSHYADAYFNNQYSNQAGSGDYTGNNYGDPEQPFLTTFKTARDANSLWRIVPSGEDGYYFVVHAKTGKYVVYEPPYNAAINRKSIHLLTTDNPGENAKFVKTEQGAGFNFRPKNVSTGNCYFNPASGNKDFYYGTDTYLHAGMIGLYSNATDANSIWRIEDAVVTPLITHNNDNTITISYPTNETDVILYYTTDGSNPNPDNVGGDNPTRLYETPFALDDEVTIVKAVAVKDESLRLVSKTVATLETPLRIGNSHLYLLQNQESIHFYMIPGSINTDNNIPVQTSSVAGANMVWYLENAGNENGLQYYFFRNNSSGGYLYRTSNNLYIKVEEETPTAINYMFYVQENEDGSYNIYNKAVNTSSILKNNGNGNSNNVILNTDITNELAHWKFIPLQEGDNQKALFVAPTFTLSTSTDEYYYKIKLVDSGYYIVTPTNGSIYATTSNTETNNNMSWKIKAATSDNWLTYYHIINAVTGEYLFFNGNMTSTVNQENAIAMKSIADLTDENAINYQFVVAHTTTDDAYYIIPKAYKDTFTGNTYYSIWRDGTNPLKTTLNRSSANIKWKFEQSSMTVVPPVITYDVATNSVSITCNTPGATIYYTTNGTIPAKGENAYSGAFPLSASDNTIQAIAIKGDQESTVSVCKVPVQLTDGERLRPYLIRSNQSPWSVEGEEKGVFYMIPGDVDANGENVTVNTTSMPRPTMEWYFKNAGLDESGNQCYYIENVKDATCLYHSKVIVDEITSHFIYVKTWVENDNGFKFYLKEQTAGYNIVPYGETANYLNKDGGNVSPNVLNLNNNATSAHTNWNFVLRSDLDVTPPFTLSDTNFNYYKIENYNSGNTGYFIVSPAEVSSTSYATTSNATDADETKWYFKQAQASTSEDWLTYYNIYNAATCDILYYTGEIGSKSLNVSAKIDEENPEDYQFAIIKSPQAGTYYIVPRKLKDESLGKIYTLYRDNSNLHITGNRTVGNISWSFPTTTFHCATPVIEYDPLSGKINITCDTPGAIIYIEGYDSEPTAEDIPEIKEENKFTGEFDASKKYYRAIAARNTDGSDRSNLATTDEIEAFHCARPIITVSSTYDVTITCATPGVEIYYIEGEGDFSETADNYGGTKYTESFTKDPSTIIKVIAIKDRNWETRSSIAIYDKRVIVITSGDQITNMDGVYQIGESFTPSSKAIGTELDPFTGTLDGKLVEFDLNHPLFGYVSGATIKNVVVRSASISTSNHAGTIANVATGGARIYNCGVKGGTISGGNYVGGLVGLLDESARVINCYSYADITGGGTVGGIVGYNNVSSTSDDIKTMVMNCMFYGDIKGGTSKAPIYNGKKITNRSDQKGLGNYNYFRGEASYVQDEEIAKTLVYNCALMAETRFLQRFEFFRYLLNSNRALAAWYATGDVANKEQMMKWVMKPSQIGTSTPYPILGEPGKYPSVVNIDAENAVATAERNKGGKLGTLDVTIRMGNGKQFNAPDSASITTTSLTLNITDKDPDHFNFNYGKVQLPYYNDVGTKNYTGNRVVTGWKIVSITGGTSGTLTKTGSDASIDAEGNITMPFNFADRQCTNKDLYSTSDRIFNQGAYWDVPDEVTAITIEPYWAKAAYLSDPYYDKVYTKDMKTGVDVTTVGGGQRYENGKSYNINGDAQIVYTSMSNAITAGAFNPNTSHTVYDYAVVLVGNYHQYNSIEGSKPYTVMSIDLDQDNEPDNSFMLRFDGRMQFHPVRYDFLNLMGLGMAQKSDEGTGSYNFGIAQPVNWFEVTNTALFRVTQFEHERSNREAKPIILQGGVIEQWVSYQNNGTSNKTTYYHVGGNVWFKEFHIGCHQDTKTATMHPPVSVTGGDFEVFYLTGAYSSGADHFDDNAECYISGGRFGTVAGTGMEGIGNVTNHTNGNIFWQIDHADIGEFFAGGINAAHPAQGNIYTIIRNSHVNQFCGGPKFGDMVSGRTVTTKATDCTFDKFFGAGYGGSSYNRFPPTNQQNKMNIDWNTWVKKEYTQAYSNDADKNGISTQFDYQFLPMSGNADNVARLFVDYVGFSLATTHSVTSDLNHCVINENFYGGGNLGKVAGNVTSTLKDCTVSGSVYGAGFSASLPTVEVDSIGFRVEPYYYEQLGSYRTAVKGATTTYTWEHAASPSIDKTNHILYTTEDLTTLGTVTGTVTLNIEGNTTVAGNVYGGGESSDATADVTVNVKDGTLKDVYGGGKGQTTVVGGDIKVNVTGGTMVDVYGGSAMGAVNAKEESEQTLYSGTESAAKTTSVTISGGTVSGSVFGGGLGEKTETTDIAALSFGNAQVNIQGGTIAKGVYGGSNANGILKRDAIVTLTGGTVGSAPAEGDAMKNLVFGGGFGLPTLVEGNITVNVGSRTEPATEGGSVTFAGTAVINGSVYGGSALGNVNAYKNNTELAFNSDKSTKVLLYKGTVKGDVYGGGLGQRASTTLGLTDVAAYVGGDVLIKLNEGIADDEKGCEIDGKIFGCNNLNGSPKGNVQVYVYATQRNGGESISDTQPINTDSYDLQAVYGGGNLAAYVPTSDKARCEVYIDGCDVTSIKQVYGGGNAASAPATYVLVNRAYEIDEVFGGGNGADPYILNGEHYINPGANVGYSNYTHVGDAGKGTGSEEDPYQPVDNTDPDASTKEKRVANYSYGTGIARTEIRGGTIHTVYGGSNAKGNIREKAISSYASMYDDCLMNVDQTYGSGKNAPIDGEVEVQSNCAKGIKEMFGGAKDADVDNNINLTITNGSSLERVFGGNNTSGAINGSITVTIQEGGCEPIRIKELYLGGFLAPYSVYGYQKDETTGEYVEADVAYTDEEGEHTHTQRVPLTTGSNPKKDPRLNVISATRIDNIYGGGYQATVVGNPHINVNMEKGKLLKEFVEDDEGYKDYEKDTEGNRLIAIGTIGNIYGGGNMADIVGDTYVEIGTGQYLDANDETVTVERNAAEITGSVYGGGNEADVTGNTNITMANGSVYNRIFGGGNLGNVGTFTTTTDVEGHTPHEGCIKKPNGCSEGTGTCNVTVSGGRVGPTGMTMPQDFGYVFGASRGETKDPTTDRDIDFRSYVNKTVVTIKGNAFITGGVYGGSENGRVLNDTKVNIQEQCQIGCGVGETAAYADGFINPKTTSVTESNSLAPCASWTYTENGLPYDMYAADTDTDASRTATDGHTFYGNVFGGGSGFFPYLKSDSTHEWLRSAGKVEGSTTVNISGGHILSNVYGGCEVADVDGACNIEMTGGTVGVPRSKEKMLVNPALGHLFGAGKGDKRAHFNTWTNVASTDVKIKGGIIYGSVYGGGEDGHVLGNAVTTISQISADTPTVIGSTGTSGWDGNVFGGGQGSVTALTAGVVGGNVEANIEGGTMLGAVYGGGRLASVGTCFAEATDATKYGKMQTGTDHGVITVNLKDGSIGGDVYGGCQGASGDDEVSSQLGLAKSTTVNITQASGENAALSIAKSVYGGGEAGDVLEDVKVEMQKGTVHGDVYGGGALANTNIANWDATNSTWVTEKYNATTKATTHTTKVILKGGTVDGNVYGGGLGRQGMDAVTPVEAKVYGDVLVKLNETTASDNCVVKGSIFGCNNQNGSPQSAVTVHVYKTQGWTDHDVTEGKNDDTIEKTGATYELAAVYGGGDQAAFKPDLEATRDTVQAYVIIDGCDLTSIKQVYGGGNAASAPATNVVVNGSYEIDEVFGGGNGFGFMDEAKTIPNPGANVGYDAYPESYDPPASSKEERTQNFSYGSGKANVTITGGSIHRVFGGSNTKGNVRESAVTMLQDLEGCEFKIDEAYGGGKSAPMDANAQLLMSCIPGLKVAYGGAQEADIQGDVVLNITNGTYNQVFGGNNISGTIRGSITVNIEETGCSPVIIGELYGGGNLAGYSVYGYKQVTEGTGTDAHLVWKPRESATDDGTGPSTPYSDPQVNVKSFTSIGNVYGGGYGETALMVGNPHVNINEVEDATTDAQKHASAEFAGDEVTIDADKDTEHKVSRPSHKKGKMGAIQNVFGGGNAAKVIGDTYVNIATEDKVRMRTLEVDSDGNLISDPSTEVINSHKKDVTGVDIRGNIYGGGNQADVTGKTNVVIGK